MASRWVVTSDECLYYLLDLDNEVMGNNEILKNNGKVKLGYSGVTGQFSWGKHRWSIDISTFEPYSISE